MKNLTDNFSDAERIALRWAQFEAESRVNLLRALSVCLFFLIHLAHYLAERPGFGFLRFLGLSDGDIPNRPTHLAITFLTLAWLAVAWGVHLLLQNKFFPGKLMYLVTALDFGLLTSVLAIVKGPSSPLVSAYFVILVMSALRLDLYFIRASTAFGVLSYVFLLGCAKWQMPLTKLNAVSTVPRYHQLIFLAAMVLIGVTLGQVVRLASGVRLRAAQRKPQG
jgi:hypothetical protein